MKTFQTTMTVSAAGETVSGIFCYGGSLRDQLERGGAAADGAGPAAVEVTLRATGVGGAGTAISIVPEFSYDFTEWFESETGFDEVTADADETLHLRVTGAGMRFRVTATGSAPAATLHFFAISK